MIVHSPAVPNRTARIDAHIVVRPAVDPKVDFGQQVARRRILGERDRAIGNAGGIFIDTGDPAATKFAGAVCGNAWNATSLMASAAKVYCPGVCGARTSNSARPL